jgi:hypothetical protein
MNYPQKKEVARNFFPTTSSFSGLFNPTGTAFNVADESYLVHNNSIQLLIHLRGEISPTPEATLVSPLVTGYQL